MDKYSKRERLAMTLKGIIPDRPPITAYRHFPVDEGKKDRLIDVMIKWQEEYDWDFIKLHPPAVYMQEVWGDTFDFDNYYQEVFPTKTGNTYGEVNLSMFTPQNADNPYLAEQVDMVHQVVERFHKELPVFQTMFTPLQTISGVFDCQFIRRHFPADRNQNDIFRMIKDEPKALQEALYNITQTYIAYWKKLHDAGAEGLFYAGVSWAREGLMTLEEWETYVAQYDRMFLNEVHKDGGLVIYHTCGITSNPQRFADFPIDILHWDQGAQNPSIKESLSFLKGITPMGGVDEMIFGNHAEAKIKGLTEKCLEENKNVPYILAPYCSVSVYSSDAELRAFRDAVK